ncbi:unnamed protein product [Oikopleura dioica]|nr:unnamed protein product [Oikopleura dioica]
MFGGIPWQVYFQRVLSSDTAYHAKLLSFFAAAGCIIMSIPPIMIGAIARSTDWSETNFFETGKYNPEECGETDKILPIVLATLTPPVVSTIGLGAISAAVMSSADSSILSAASMFTHNIWSESISPGSSERAVMRVMRVSIVTVGAIATVLAIKGTSVYSLWYLSGDIVYVTLFPQLLLVVHFEDRINARGSQIGLLLGVIIRAIGGDTGLNIPALVEFPGYDCKTNTQYFPFRSLAMIVTLLGCLVGSAVFADPHPISEEEEDTPFYKKGKSPIISSPAGGETIDKLRLEDAVFEEDENAPRNAE